MYVYYTCCHNLNLINGLIFISLVRKRLLVKKWLYRLKGLSLRVKQLVRVKLGLIGLSLFV